MKQFIFEWRKYLNENEEEKLDLSFIQIKSFAVPTEEAVREIVSHGPIIEIGAGKGYWAKKITDAGGDILAYDAYLDKELYFPVQKGGPEKVKNTDRTLFLCYPDLDSNMAFRCLRNYEKQLMQGKKLLVIGEEGITADDRFWIGLENLGLRKKTIRLPHISSYYADLHVYWMSNESQPKE
jgi:hypothetical protein